MGASEDHDAQGDQQQNGQQQADSDGNADAGFPANTPVAQMTDAQKAAYYLHQNRQTDNKLKAFNGFTPQDVSAMWSRLEELETERLSASDKALRDATEQAASAARTEVEAQWQSRVQQLQLENVASRVIKDDNQLQAFLAITDPAKFVGDNGEIDQEKVKTHLTPLLGVGGDRQWGQYGSRPPGKSASEEGLAEARRRGYLNDKE